MFRINQLVEEFKNIKNSEKFIVVDSHVHPFDVMGVIHHDKHVSSSRSYEDKIYKLKPTLSEILKYGKIANFLSQPTCYIFPKYVNNMLRDVFVDINEEKLVYEMRHSFVDKSVLVPIEPWSMTSSLHENFQDKNFYLLGSIDPHTIKYEDIDTVVASYKSRYNIKGIKLHPNLQNFHPQPSCNNDELKLKLLKIYESIEKNNLYLLIHGGKSFFSNTLDNGYKNIKRSRTFGVLNNYVSKQGNSELFENFKMPIIIAHLGHYGTLKEDLNLFKNITHRYSNVYFDTAGSSPKLLSNILKNFGGEKIIFGSDAVYNSMLYNVMFTYFAIKKSSKQLFYSNLHNIFENNIMQILNR